MSKRPFAQLWHHPYRVARARPFPSFLFSPAVAASLGESESEREAEADEREAAEVGQESEER